MKFQLSGFLTDHKKTQNTLILLTCMIQEKEYGTISCLLSLKQSIIHVKDMCFLLWKGMSEIEVAGTVLHKRDAITFRIH